MGLTMLCHIWVGEYTFSDLKDGSIGLAGGEF